MRACEHFPYARNEGHVLAGRRNRESDVLGALSDIYSDLIEASMNFQAHYGVTLPFNVPSHAYDDAHRVRVRAYACTCVRKRNLRVILRDVA